MTQADAEAAIALVDFVRGFRLSRSGGAAPARPGGFPAGTSPCPGH